MQRKLYILPGFGESISDKPYQDIAKEMRKCGYAVTPVSLTWRYNAATRWLEEFRKAVKKNGEDAYVLGFSFGAYIAVLASREFSFKKLHICSLSPYFREDLSTLPELAYKILGKKRMEDFARYPFPQNIRIPAVFYVGNEDISFVKSRVGKAYKEWKGNKKFISVEGVGHTLDAPDYLKALYKELKK